MIRLRWVREGDTEIAYLGELSFGAVGKLIPSVADPGKPYWWIATHAVHMRHISKTDGHVARRSTGRKAVERAWDRWSKLAGINP